MPEKPISGTVGPRWNEHSQHFSLPHNSRAVKDYRFTLLQLQSKTGVTRFLFLKSLDEQQKILLLMT